MPTLVTMIVMPEAVCKAALAGAEAMIHQGHRQTVTPAHDPGGKVLAHTGVIVGQAGQRA